MTDPHTEDTLRWMAPIFTRRRADGEPYYSDADVRAFLPALLVSLGFDPRQAPPQLTAMVGAFAQAAGVTAEDPREVVAAKLQAHLAAQPLNPELVFEVSRGLREEQATYSPEELAREVAVALGLARPAVLAPAGPPPEGAVRAGPMARFALADEVPSVAKRRPRTKPRSRR